MSDLPTFLWWLTWVNFGLLAFVVVFQAVLIVRVNGSVRETRDLLRLVKACQSIAGRQQEVATRLVSDVPNVVKDAIKESGSSVLGRGRNGGGPCPEG